MTYITSNIRYLKSFFAGFISGLLGGLLGVTGSVIIIPLLLIFSIFENYKTAIGTVLFTSDPLQSIFAVIEYARNKKIEYLIAGTLFVSYVFGSYFGAKYNNYFAEKTLKYMTAFIFLFITMYLFYDVYNYKK